MSHIFRDPDVWESVSESRPCTACRPNPDGGMSICTGMCNGMVSMGWRQRTPDEVAKLKAEHLRAYEEAVLAEAEQIKARRAAEPRP